MAKRMDAEKRAINEEKRRRGLVPLKPMQDPFKKMAKDREKKRKADEKAKREEEERLRLEQLKEPKAETPKLILVVKDGEGDKRSLSKSPGGKTDSYDTDSPEALPKIKHTADTSPKRKPKVPPPDKESEPEKDKDNLKNKEKPNERKSRKDSVPDKDNKDSERVDEKEFSKSPNRTKKSKDKQKVKEDDKEVKKKEGKEKSDKEKERETSPEKAAMDKEKETEKVQVIVDKEQKNEILKKQDSDKADKEDKTAEPKPKDEKKKKNKNIIVKSKMERQISNVDHVVSKYEPGKVLGDGNFAIVKQCKLKNTNQEYAMKIIDKSKLKGKEGMVENEIAIMKMCNQPNIVKLVEEFETDKEIYLIMELVKVSVFNYLFIYIFKFVFLNVSYHVYDWDSKKNEMKLSHGVYQSFLLLSSIDWTGIVCLCWQMCGHLAAHCEWDNSSSIDFIML